MSKKKAGTHIVGIDVENFHRLKAAHIELVPGAGLVRVTGKNKAGKTSLLRSIAAALGGAGEVLPAAINTGSDDGTGRVTLSTYKNSRRKRRKCVCVRACVHLIHI